MTKRYYTIFSLGVISIFTLQTIFIFILYENFTVYEQEKIENSMCQALDLELHYRKVKDKSNVEYSLKTRSFAEYSKQEQDSLVKIYPFLKNSPKNNNRKYDLQKLFNEGQIRSEGDIHTHNEHDHLYELGTPIVINILDSLFDAKLDRGYANSISIVNSADSLVDYIGDRELKYNYKTKLAEIGFKGYQSVYTEVYIPLSSFVKKSILVIILSFITILIVLSALLYLVIVLKKREEELNRRELSISGVIHDLKSPLINVSAMLDFLEITEMDKQTHSFIIQSQKSVDNLIFRIESLLHLSRRRINETTVMPEYITKSKTEEYIDFISQELKQLYKEKDIVLSIENGIKDGCNIDLVNFNSVVANLIENAMKYSYQNVTIKIELHQTDNGYIVINVKDNGLGIEKKFHKKIFKQYQRVENNNIKGYGIGLAYARQIARANGGDVILVESTKEIGSYFRVIFKEGL